MLPLAQLHFGVNIYVVIVLYNQTPASSPAVTAWLEAVKGRPELSDAFRLLLYDHSANAQPGSGIEPAHASWEYAHDPTNAGLATAYNYALARAALEGCTWLLLLDQDTEVRTAYLEEVLALTERLGNDPRVAAIVPKLESDKGIKSPTLDFLEWLRRQVQFPRKRPLFADKKMYGLQEEQLSAFNSASVLRIEALQKIGGFPKEYWLDFLDVAVYDALYAMEKRMYVMHATLRHELSMDTKRFYEKQSGLDRHRNLLAAMVRFVRRRGTPRDLWLARLWLLRNALNLLLSARDKRFSLASLQQAIRLRDTLPRRS